MLFLWLGFWNVSMIVGAVLFLRSLSKNSIVQGLVGLGLLILGMGLLGATFGIYSEVESGYDEADYAYYLVSQNEERENPLYAVNKDGQLYYLYRDENLVKEGHVATSCTEVSYFEQGELGEPCVEIHEIVHHIDNKVWFIKDGEKDVVEWHVVFHVPRGSIVSYYDLS